jgi:hypothetical protein
LSLAAERTAVDSQDGLFDRRAERAARLARIRSDVAECALVDRIRTLREAAGVEVGQPALRLVAGRWRG